jgi:hypothetical protein
MSTDPKARSEDRLAQLRAELWTIQGIWKERKNAYGMLQ